VVNKAFKYFHVLISDTEHTVITCLCFFFLTLLCLIVFFKIFIGFKMYTVLIIL